VRLRQESAAYPAVIEAQTHLAALGFPLGATGPHHDGVDGKPGEMTSAALQAFQQCAGLRPNGQPDGATLSALRYAVQSRWTMRDLARRALERGAAMRVTPSMDRADFVNGIFLLAVLDEERTGVPATVTTAQAILESNYGREAPADLYDRRNSHNLFGIKGEGPAGSVAAWTDEEVDGAMTRVVARFRAYQNFAESIADHSSLLAGSSRYRPLLASRDPHQWAQGLQSAGYATDSGYARKLQAIMDYWWSR